jgi:protein-tyrosine phosphatase
MSHPFDVIELNHGGRLLVTPCPGTKTQSMGESMATLASAGAVALITLMQPEEQARYGIHDLEKAAKAAGMQWFELPIDDDEKPTELFEQRWQAHKATLLSLLQGGQTVALHCKGGQGRTSLVSALLMLELGYSWDTLKEQIQSVKPRALVIEKHLEYLADYRAQKNAGG